MKQLIPTEQIQQTGIQFPVEGEDAQKICCLVTMELFGSSKSEVARAINGTVDDVDDLCLTPEYARIKQTIIDNVRELDRRNLSGQIMQEAKSAFNRMVELSNDAAREDVKFNANKDILDRAMLTSAAAQSDELTIKFVKRH